MAASLILRTVKGTPLTNLEVDNNFSNLSTFANTVDSNIGVLSALTTTAKSNIVFAVNELKAGSAVTSANIRQFAAGTSSDLAAAVPDKTGTANVVFNVGPVLYLPTVDNIKIGYATAATAGGTTTLDVNSKYQQIFTGSSNQTVQLPVVSTLAVGMCYHIENNSTGTLTITSSGGNTVITVPPLLTVMVTCISTSGTDATSWDYDYHAFGGITGTGNTVLATNATMASPTFTGLVTANSMTLSNVLTTTKIVETVVAIGNTGTAATIDLSLGTVFTATLNGSATLTVSNPGTVSSFTLVLTNDATPNRTVAFSGGTFKSPGGSVTRTTTANAIDVWFFFTPNGGTTWYYSIPMANLS
ncbi:hypothetical protein UFOVP242_130 [uncultured Caudovirales phage]|uniref:Uncharacterized protein n=1 Tax=uncultured Caudovirales phage TaxID=2100421 RepID=A0A6J7WUY7_9CAUD|nr:hypothetical protein UFOVP242_130 [uncultured Caudovirales phage]